MLKGLLKIVIKQGYLRRKKSPRIVTVYLTDVTI